MNTSARAKSVADPPFHGGLGEMPRGELDVSGGGVRWKTKHRGCLASAGRQLGFWTRWFTGVGGCYTALACLFAVMYLLTGTRNYT
ncbi:MAG: hypothetical protein QHJ73_16650, partial [Armatimonadota bacterium]|nr:hypothetical protein [Armatimonadota bacterium]